MKVAHFVVITPGLCGLYETTREIVAALRVAGVDSRMFDPTRENNKHYPEGGEDRGALFCGEDWVDTADVWVSHSGLGKWELNCVKPVLYVAHGRPKSSFIGEKNGGTPVYSYHYTSNGFEALKAVVTLWPEHMPYLQFMFPDKPVKYVPACVDLKAWSPGHTSYDFAGNSGTINAVIADSWRDDIDPFVPMHAFGLWAREQTNAKLHLYAKPKHQKGWAAIIRRLQDDGTLGVYQGWAKNLNVVYRAADMVLTGNEIDVRTVREAEACGCPVVRFPSANISDFNSKLDAALTANPALIRKRAEGSYNSERTAIEFIKVLEDVNN